MARIDLKKTTVVLKDGTTPTANTLSIKIGVGNITFDTNKDFVYVTNRGLLDTVRKGPQKPVDVKFEATFETLEIPAGQSPLVSVVDFLKKRGNAAGYITTDSDLCQPYCVDIIVTQDQQCSGVPTEVVTLALFRYEKGTFDIKNGQISFTGRCNIVTPTIQRV